MANIYRVDSRTEVPDIARAVNPVLDVPMMDFESIASALDSYSTEEQNNVANAEENFNQLVEINDKLTGERFDNANQAAVFDKAKKDMGLDDNSFRVSMDDLRDPFKVRSLRSKLGQIYERSDVKQILFEQQRGKEYLDKIIQLKDMNPGLYKKALAKYNKYRNGEINGLDLLPQEFTPIDMDKTITDALKLVPQIDTSDIERKHGLVYEKIRKQRSREVIDSVIKQLEANDIFRNNMEARFTNEAGEFDKDAYDKYVDGLATEYAKEHTNIENVRQEKDSKTEKPTKLDRLVANIAQLGGDSDKITGKIAELESILTDTKNKSLSRVEETGAEVRVYYKDIESGEERFVSIPKSNAAAMEAPVGYKVDTGDGQITLSDEELKTFNDEADIIEDLDWFGKSHTAPIEGAKSNVGKKAFAKVENGVLVTNDITFLREHGLVPKDTDYDELGKLGWEYEMLPDKTTVVKKSVKSNKRVVNSDAIDLTGLTIHRKDIDDVPYKSVPQEEFKSSVEAKNILNVRPPGEKAFKSYATYEDAIKDSVKLMLRYYEGTSGPMRAKKKQIWDTEGLPPTIEEVIRTWSPSKDDCVKDNKGREICGDTNESTVKTYIEKVAEELDVTGDTPVSKIGIVNLTKAMASMECPKCLDEINKEYGSFEALFKKAFNVKDAPAGTEMPEQKADIRKPEDSPAKQNIFSEDFTPESEPASSEPASSEPASSEPANSEIDNEERKRKAIESVKDLGEEDFKSAIQDMDLIELVAITDKYFEALPKYIQDIIVDLDGYRGIRQKISEEDYNTYYDDLRKAQISYEAYDKRLELENSRKKSNSTTSNTKKKKKGWGQDENFEG